MTFEILGEPMPVVVCDVNADESMITEREIGRASCRERV